MFVGFLGLHLTRFGQSHRKNGVSALIRACVQLISGTIQYSTPITSLPELFENVISAHPTGMASFWLVGFSLANSRSENPFLAFDYNKIYIHDATLLGGTTLIDKFLIQVSSCCHLTKTKLSTCSALELFFLSYA